MAFDTDQGDRVYLADNERLDKPDYDAAVDLMNATLGRLLGLLVGNLGSTTLPLGGCVSPLVTSWDAGTNYLTIDGGLLFQGGTLTSPVDAPGGRIINYDPTASWQLSATGIDLTGQDPDTCIIWATRTRSLSNLDTRKKWAPGAVAESTFGTTTRWREVVTFVATNATFNGSGQVTAYTAPPVVADYFPVLKITAWPAGVPTVAMVSVWDGTPSLGLIGDVNTRMDLLGNGTQLGSIVYRFRQCIAALLDQTLATNWSSAGAATYRGIKQLDTDLTAAEADIVTAQVEINVLQERTGYGTITAFTVSDGGSWAVDQGNVTARLSSFLYAGAGTFEFDIDSAYLGSSPFSEVTGISVETISADGLPPSTVLLHSTSITDPVLGTFKIYFFTTGGILTEPPVEGFSVTVSGY